MHQFGMHPSRLVSLTTLVVSVLIIAQSILIGELQATASTALLLSGGIILLGSSLYGLVRYEENPIVTEYGPMTYLFLFGSLLLSAGIIIQFITG